MFSRTATCKYNYPAVPLSLWLATHASCASLPPYSAAVSNLIPRLFSPILSSSPAPPPTLPDFSSRLTTRILPLPPAFRSVLGASPAHCLLSLHSNYPRLSHSRAGTTRCRSPPSRPLPFRASCPYSSRTSLAVFTLIVAVLLNPLRIVCARARDAACCSKKIGARFENAPQRCPHPPPRSSVHLSASRATRPRDRVFTVA